MLISGNRDKILRFSGKIITSFSAFFFLYRKFPIQNILAIIFVFVNRCSFFVVAYFTTNLVNILPTIINYKLLKYFPIKCNVNFVSVFTTKAK